jgi:hypothetical protein
MIEVQAARIIPGSFSIFAARIMAASFSLSRKLAGYWWCPVFPGLLI